MILRQLFDEETGTYTYLLGDEASREAVLIDPVSEQIERDLQLIAELDLRLVLVLDTHVHADHITASGALRQRTGARCVVSAAGGVECIDQAVAHGDLLRFGATKIEVRATPGHTAGCVSYIVRADERVYAFTGDALMIRGCGRTDFQQGDSATLYASVHEQLFSLPGSTIVYPGHDYRGHRSSTIAEEKAHNPRLNTAIEAQEFVAIMGALNLAHPKQIDRAVPANLRCGEEQPASASPSPRDLAPHQLDDLSAYRIIDVRQPEEFEAELGHLEGAELVPLATVASAASAWAVSAHLLLVCRSGGRSGVACSQLAGRGFSNLTNLRGGMLAWNAFLEEVGR